MGFYMILSYLTEQVGLFCRTFDIMAELHTQVGKYLHKVQQNLLTDEVGMQTMQYQTKLNIHLSRNATPRCELPIA